MTWRDRLAHWYANASLERLGCLAFVAAAVVIWILVEIRDSKKIRHLAPFQTHLQIWTAYEGEPTSDGAYVKGKIILIDHLAMKIDNLTFDLPEELRPSSPEEVGTVIWLEWYTAPGPQYVAFPGSSQPVGRGSFGACRVVVIDVSTRVKLCETHIKSDSPVAPNSDPAHPTGKVIEYLMKLPRTPR